MGTKLIVSALAALALAATAQAALPGKVLARKSASGQFAVTAINADVKRPKAIYIRLIGGITNSSAIVACSRGSTISSNSYTRNKPGLYRLPIKPARADDCSIILSGGGSGRITIEIRAVR